MAEKKLIVNKHMGFVSVADPYMEELWASSAFEESDAGRASAAPFLSHMQSIGYLREILPRLGASDGQGATQGATQGVEIVDCGVYMGMFAAALGILARDLDIPTAISCYEANPRLLDGIAANLAFYGTPAEIHNFGVAGQEATMDFGFAEGRMIGGTLRNAAKGKAHLGTVTTFEIRTVPLASALRDAPEMGLVKLDIEGSEVDAFSSISDSPNKLNNVFIVEFNPYQRDMKIDGSGYLDWLMERYSAWDLGGWPNGRKPERLSSAEGLDAKIAAAAREHNTDLLLVPKGQAELAAAIDAL